MARLEKFDDETTYVIMDKEDYELGLERIAEDWGPPHFKEITPPISGHADQFAEYFYLLGRSSTLQELEEESSRKIDFINKELKKHYDLR